MVHLSGISVKRSKSLSIRNRNRREFLLEAGVALSGVAAGPHLLAEIAGVRRNFTVPENDPAHPTTAKMRGLMMDGGRVPESLDYYRRAIEFCADWELNTLHFRLADDQGSALRFTSAPDLVTHRNAFKPEELRGLAEYAQSHGIDLIPELESFGHTGYITRAHAYAHLLDSDPQGSAEFTGMIPVHPETLELFDKLYREVAAIFPSPYLHGGCDEVNWGGSALSQKALQAKTRPQIWAEYLNALNQMSQKLGKQFIVWGDFVLHKEPEILGQLDKNIVIMDWNYWDNSSATVHAAFTQVRANGSRGIGAPGLINYKWGPRAGSEQLRNIDAFADAYLGSNEADSLGVILTNWVPSRYIQNSIWDGFAYAAVAFKEGTATAQTTAFRRFVERHYRAQWNEDWSEAFQIVYNSAPSVEESAKAWMGLVLPVPWSNDRQLAAVLTNQSPRPNPFTRLRSLLLQVEPLLRKNLSDFQAFQLCAEYLERMFWREEVVANQAAKSLDRETAGLLIQSLAARDAALAEALRKDWDEGRFPDSAASLEPVIDLEPKDQLLFQWEQAAAYSASLASHPDHFYQIVTSATLRAKPRASTE
jgi:hypothetical protein